MMHSNESTPCFEKKPKINGFVEDSHLLANEKDYKSNQKKDLNEEFDEVLSEKTPNIKKKFAEDTINNSTEKKTMEMTISPKLLKKKKADYIYDFVKIRVHLDNHFYILSRFFISRMLTLCKVKVESTKNLL